MTLPKPGLLDSRCAALLRGLAFVALAVVAWLFASMVREHLGQVFSANSEYEGSRIFGEHCGYAVEPAAAEPLELARRVYPWKQLYMPYRAAPFDQRPSVPVGGALITRCALPLDASDRAGFGWIYLGRVFGPSWIFVNERLVLEQSDDGRVGIPLSPLDKREEVEIKIVSRRDPQVTTPGLPTLAPIAYMKDREIYDRIARNSVYFRVEGPAFRVAAISAFMVIFGCVWLLGIRYADVAWMLVAIATSAVAEYFNYHPLGAVVPWHARAEVIAIFASSLAFVAFVAAFLRLPLARGKLVLVWLGLVAVYAAAMLGLDDDIVRVLSLHEIAPAGLASIGAAAVAIFGKPNVEHLDERRRNRIGAMRSVAWIAAFGFLVEAAFAYNQALYVQPFVHLALIFTFGGLLGSDLVVFHRRFFEEKARRLEREKRAVQLEERLALGRSVQELLMPRTMEGQFARYFYRCFHQVAEILSGDWVFFWSAGDVRHLVMGDVVGKGPSAAIAVSVIIEVLHEAREKNVPIREATERINASLKRLFDGQITTTLSVVTLHADGRVHLIGSAAPEWIVLARDDVRSIRLPGTPLGTSDTARVTEADLTLSPGEALVGFTDGFLDSVKGRHVLVKNLRTKPATAWTPDAILAAVETAGEGITQVDDKTMLVIQAKP